MNIESLRNYIIQKPFVTESFPFGDKVLVFKKQGKIFLLASLDSIPFQFNVKCDPEMALELREAYPQTILPGYHMSKKHWNTILVDGVLSDKQLFEMVDESYRLVGGGK
jgi:predicted DNA-binding protein (MmcQ/YjbR family)